MLASSIQARSGPRYYYQNRHFEAAAVSSLEFPQGACEFGALLWRLSSKASVKFLGVTSACCELSFRLRDNGKVEQTKIYIRFLFNGVCGKARRSENINLAILFVVAHKITVWNSIMNNAPLNYLNATSLLGLFTNLKNCVGPRRDLCPFSHSPRVEYDWVLLSHLRIEMWAKTTKFGPRSRWGREAEDIERIKSSYSDFKEGDWTVNIRSFVIWLLKLEHVNKPSDRSGNNHA